MPKFHTPMLGQSDIQFNTTTTLTGRVLFSTGYSGERLLRKASKVEAFDALVRRLGLFVVDTRLNPWSRASCWRKDGLGGLANRLGSMHVFPDGLYLPVPELGNVNYNNGGPIKIDNLDYGVEEVLFAANARRLAPLLLCACEDLECCHRQVVARAFAPHFDKWVELNYWDDPKMLGRDGTLFGELQPWKAPDAPDVPKLTEGQIW